MAQVAPVGRVIAHRGWSTAFPENTLPTLVAGLCARVDEIEFDVRLSRDGVPVLVHDESLERITDLEGPCREYTVAELQAAPLRMADGSLLRGLGIGTLDAVLDLLAGRIGMNIHIKTPEATEPTLIRLRAAGLIETGGEVYVAGDRDVLEQLIRLSPELPRCCLADAKDPELLLQNALDLGCRRLQFRSNYTQSAVRRARAQGLLPNLFYADTPEEAERAVRDGIVGIVTNNAGPIRQHLAAKGLLSRS